ncbi:DUF938 domain-containing protein [uncultured Endozoicomonas sp.]|uniref:DUF938 domain-containing protein n=1 Tax=uncultured Endozoicomonas sp. TaxID=432652 RepID=UPI00262FC965|nr:DUF938 domain-containing protein [uncultured Endozoicomonas sp.]
MTGTDAQASVKQSDSELPIAESCLRNQKPIAEVLHAELPKHSFVLEIGSGTGQHAAYFTSSLRNITWQPSDVAELLPGIKAWREQSGSEKFLPPIVLDITQTQWPVAEVDAVFCANVVHFVGWSKVHSMLKGISRVLKDNGLVFFYGPYNYDGKFTSDGNRELDEWLRQRDAESGIKDFEQVVLAANKAGLNQLKDIEMPANNRILILKKYENLGD